MTNIGSRFTWGLRKLVLGSKIKLLVTTKNHLPTHILVIGAGPGGLTAAMLLANRGFKVTVFEKAAQVGGERRRKFIERLQ